MVSNKAMYMYNVSLTGCNGVTKWILITKYDANSLHLFKAFQEQQKNQREKEKIKVKKKEKNLN